MSVECLNGILKIISQNIFICQDRVDLAHLHHLASQVNIDMEVARANYKSYLSQNRTNIQALRLYGSFLMELANVRISLLNAYIINILLPFFHSVSIQDPVEGRRLIKEAETLVRASLQNFFGLIFSYPFFVLFIVFIFRSCN